MKKKVKNIIIGAGLTGLLVAYFLEKSRERDYLILEKEKVPGGLLRSIYRNGYTIDFTGHFLHFQHKKIKGFVVKEFLRDNYREIKRRSFVFLNKTFVKYPFQYNTYGLSQNIIQECLKGLIEAQKNRSDKKPLNFYDWILAGMGRGIAKYFMAPYNQKLWTIHPRNLTTEWIGKFVPSPNINQFLAGTKKKRTKDVGYNVRFLYPKSGGIYSLIKGILNYLDESKILYNTNIKRIDPKEKKVIFKNGNELFYENLIATLPLKELISLLVVSSRIKALSNKLNFISVYNLNLGIKGIIQKDKHWIYFPEKKFPFYRVGFSSNVSKQAAPKRHSLIYTEVSYSRYKPLDKENIDKNIIAGLIKAGIIKKKTEIVFRLPLNIKYAYVLYDKNWKSTTTKIHNFLSSKNIFSIGRYGKWYYGTMENNIIKARNIVRKLT